jgi:hypothetical protein
MPTLKSLLVREDKNEVMEQEIGVLSPRSKSWRRDQIADGVTVLSQLGKTEW